MDKRIKIIRDTIEEFQKIAGAELNKKNRKFILHVASEIYIRLKKVW